MTPKEAQLQYDYNFPMFPPNIEALNDKLLATSFCLADLEKAWQDLKKFQFCRIDGEIQYSKKRNWLAVARFNHRGSLLCLGIPHKLETTRGNAKLNFSAAVYIFGTIDKSIVSELIWELTNKIGIEVTT